jgi:hypothetical protein
MEMAGKQFFPFMEMVVPPSFTTVQLRLTACATASYSLCNCVLQLVQLRLTAYGNGYQAVLPIYGTVCATASYSLCNCVLQIVQPSLTACATASYKLCNPVLRLMEMVSKQFSHLCKRF